MPDLHKRIDPLSFPILGLFGAVACGPIAPQTGETDGTSDGTGTDSTSAGPSTDPTVGPTDPTRPTTTEPPMPECRSSADCDDIYCGYCSEGVCRESVGCCGEYVAKRTDTKWRCSPPYDCYSDDECDFGYACLSGGCIESPPIPLPGCPSPDGVESEWNLGTAPSAFLLADIDGDLDLDLAAVEPTSKMIEIRFNDGAGDFGIAGANIQINPEPIGDLALAAGDLDGDGEIDLAVTQHDADGVLHLLFNDGLTFNLVSQPTAPLPVQVFIADIDGDNNLDIATIHEAEPSFGVHLGDGAGNFSPVQPGIPEPVGARAWVGDLSLDGFTDLLAPFPGTASFMAWSGGGGPLLNPLRQFEAPEAAAAATLALLGADLDLQGLPDVVLVHPQDATGMVQVWAGNAPGEWSSGRQRYLTTRPLLGGVLAELDATPGPDLLSATGQSDIVVLPGDGKGGFACEHLLGTAGPSAPALIAVGDVDNDGRPDILAGSSDTPTVRLLHLNF